MNKYAYTVMKNTDPIYPMLVIRLTLFTLFIQTSVVMITALTKAVMDITYSKKLKLYIES